MSVEALRKEFREIPDWDFSFLLCELWDCTIADLPFRNALSPDEEEHLRLWLERLKQGEPPQYVVHRAWFNNLELYVDPRVLIPRFDTEVLVEAVLAYLKPGDRILEIGVGSGAIALALKSQFPMLSVTATDIDEGALEVARINRDKLQLEVELVHADLFPPEGERFDLIISNPPYISPLDYCGLESRVKDFEPVLALLAQDEGLAIYRRIISRASQYLKDSGILAFEHGYKQQQVLRDLTESAGFETLQMGKDLAMKDRFLITRLNKSPRG